MTAIQLAAKVTAMQAAPLRLRWGRFLFVFVALVTGPGCRSSFTDSSDVLQAPAQESAVQSLMDPTLWEPAGSRISAVFPGTSAAWLQQAAALWTLPGMDVPRSLIQRGDTQVPNHQQFSVATRREYGALQLWLEFRFADEDTSALPLSWSGNSGIFLAGLYEIQLFDTGRFFPQQLISPALMQGGRLRLSDGGRHADLAPNQILCGAVYEGGVTGNTLAGAPTRADGSLVNACNRGQEWNEMMIVFHPPAFDAAGLRIRMASVSVTVNGTALPFAGEDSYLIPGPTGSLRNLRERTRGPLVIQDHGSRVSFRNIRIRAL